METFLDVHEEHLIRKLLIVDNPAEAGSGDSAELWKEPSKILMPSEKMEASQCKFVIPNPGLCIKTRDELSKKKVFVNLCHSEDVPEPQVNLTDQQLADILDAGTDNELDDIRFPMSIGEKRDELDKGGSESFACDVIVNSNFFKKKVLDSDMYRTFFIVVALEGIDEKHKMNLDKNGYKILQNAKSFGKLTPQFLKSKAGIREVNSSEPVVISQSKSDGRNTGKVTENKTKNRMIEVVSSETSVNITIIQVSEELAKAKAQLPPMKDPSKIEVEMGADRIIINSPVGSLDIFVPLDIYQEKCRAEFDVTTSILSLTMPLAVKP